MLREAIEGRQVVAFDYEGTMRFVEPHALGRNKDGDLILRGFQTGGESSSLNFGWKLFTVSKMFNVRVAPPRKDFNPADKAMKGGIIAALQPEEADVE